MEAKRFNYNRAELRTGILHFGVGGFHRAHLQSYTNSLLNNGGNKDWAIAGAMIMPQDEVLYRNLKNQGGAYSLTVCGRDGHNDVEWIGSLTELYFAGEDLDGIINKVASADTRIISLTITEGGYTLDTDSVREDLRMEGSPKTVFGIVAEGLRRRIANSGGALTILSCDNLQHNGDVCKRVFSEFFASQDSALAAWAEENITYPNSMVDRITPSTTANDIERINTTLDKADSAPVYCEDYLQWVVEDNFAAGRPSWEEVGVEFTEDVSPYEKMKLSLLNASHTLLSYPSVLSGYVKVDDSMRDERIVKFVRDFMDKDVTPHTPAPGNTDLELYKLTLIERFANSAVSDQLSRLCGDGASKFPVYVMPVLKAMLENGDDVVRIAYLIASYRHYLKYKVDGNGDAITIFEPSISADDMERAESDDAVLFLGASVFSLVNLFDYPDFVSLYEEMVERIKVEGAMDVLEGII